jgi:hypothetical protein
MTRRVVFVALCCLLGVAGIAGTASAAGTAPAAGTQAAGNTHVETCAATPPADHADPGGETDGVIGWVEGYWYDEPVDVTPADGLDSDELSRLTARTAARVEALRCHDFEGLPPLRTVSRAEFRRMVENETLAAYDTEGRQFTNARLAAMLLVGREDAVNVTIESQASFPAAFYDPQAEFMGFVTEDATSVTISEPLLAHELVHALQDDYFDIERAFDAATNDDRIASLAVVESDATFVEERYRRNCGPSGFPGVPGGSERRWTDECIIPRPAQPTPPNWGLTLNQLAAYNAPLVEQTYEREGWDGVDDLFESFPDSMVEALDPAKYGEFERPSLTVPDRSAADWERVSPPGNGSLAYDIVGQHGMTAILAAPSLETFGGTNVIDSREFQPVPGELNFDIPTTDGWRADKLYGYANASGATGAVWQSRWTDADNASQFASAYADLVAFRGGESVANGSAFTFDDSERFEMALALNQTGDTVQIVTAPTLDALDAVHQSVAVADENETDDGGSDNAGDGSDGDGTDDSDGESDTDDSDGDGTDDTDGGNSTDAGEGGNTTDSGADGSGPGFGIVAVVVAVCGWVLAARSQ